MRTNSNRTWLYLVVSVLPMVLLAPMLRAAELTPWDAMRGTFVETVAITTNGGKHVNGTGDVFFNPTSVAFAGVTYSRRDVKEVVIRRRREACCEPLLTGALPLILLVGGIADHSLPRDTLPLIIAVSPVVVGMAAVTGAPLLIIEGIRRLKPAKVLYRVVP